MRKENVIVLKDCVDVKDKPVCLWMNNIGYNVNSWKHALNMLVIGAVDSNKASALESARLIKFQGVESGSTLRYKNYVYVVPKRTSLLITKVIRICDVVYGGSDKVYVEFDRSSEDILFDVGAERDLRFVKYREEEKQLLMKFLKCPDLEKTDEELHDGLINDLKRLESLGVWKPEHWDGMRVYLEDPQRLRQSIMENHVNELLDETRRKLDDSKQCFICNCTMEEYQKQKYENIRENRNICDFLNYLYFLQNNVKDMKGIMNYITTEGLYEFNLADFVKYDKEAPRYDINYAIQKVREKYHMERLYGPWENKES